MLMITNKTANKMTGYKECWTAQAQLGQEHGQKFAGHIVMLN